jgi:molybdate transport system permease protein
MDSRFWTAGEFMIALLRQPEWQAVAISLKIAAGVVVCSAGPGVLLGWLLARKQFPGKALLNGAIHLPLVLPPVVTGYLLLVGFGRHGILGRWLEQWFGARLVFTTAGATLAAAIVAFPLLVRSVRLSMERVDPNLERASRSLGVGAVRTFFRVTLPLALPGILAGLVLAFARSLGEFGATITFAGNIAGETRGLPLAIFTELQRVEGDAAVWRLVTISVVLSMVAMLASELLARRVRRNVGGRES